MSPNPRRVVPYDTTAKRRQLPTLNCASTDGSKQKGSLAVRNQPRCSSLATFRQCISRCRNAGVRARQRHGQTKAPASSRGAHEAALSLRFQDRSSTVTNRRGFLRGEPQLKIALGALCSRCNNQPLGGERRERLGGRAPSQMENTARRQGRRERHKTRATQQSTRWE